MLIYLILVLLLAGFAAYSVCWLQEQGKPIIPRAPADASFAEVGCSGHSPGKLGSRFIGGLRCLLVYVHDGRLVVTFKFPFNLLFAASRSPFGLRVPISAISLAMPTHAMFGRAVRIDFSDADHPPIILRIRDVDGLIHHLVRIPVDVRSQSDKS